MRRIVFCALASCAVVALMGQESWKDRPVLDTSRSSKAVLRGVPVSAVQMHPGFWSARQKVNIETSLPTLLQLFEEKGIIDNFRRVSGRKQVARRGPLYTDSDVYKWLEAVAFVLQARPHPELRRKADGVIDDIAAAQQPDGYLNTFFSGPGAKEPRHSNMRGGHELYCLGHMTQAGIAWYRATGERKLLDSSIRMIEYLMREFGAGKKPIYEGHPEFELALIELSRTTGERKYVDFAGYFLAGDERNLANTTPRDHVYLFTVKPFASRTQFEGHAVRAMYAASGATDYYLETGDAPTWKTLNVLWDDMAKRKIYLTGGVGSRAAGEAFGEPYELPNQQAYTESCAAIGTMFWNWRMLQATADSKYMDLFERSLYNGANSGMSLAGNLYCYRNPLELTGNKEDRIRNPWYDTTCCPPNLQRILASLPGYFYSTSSEGLWVHLFDNNTLKWKLEDGSPVELTQVTKYPWDGRVEMTVNGGNRDFTLFVRKPWWAEDAKLEAPRGATVELKSGYWRIRQQKWGLRDRVVVTLGMRERLTAPNQRIREDLGKVAVERGPLVYCMEGMDQPGGDSNLFEWTLETNGGAQPRFTSEFKADLLNGVVVLRHPASRPSTAAADSPLYQTLRKPGGGNGVSGEVTLVPYYTFHNRDITPMQVWIPYR